MTTKRSGYYHNLGSLRAGMRHHGEFSFMGTPSHPPFLLSYWLMPVQMTGQLSRSMQILRGNSVAGEEQQCLYTSLEVKRVDYTPTDMSTLC